MENAVVTGANIALATPQHGLAAAICDSMHDVW